MAVATENFAPIACPDLAATATCLLIASGTLGLLLLWPDTEKARLLRATAENRARARWQVAGTAERTAKAP